MTKLAWDETGERRYEAGVDHGVLYLAEGVVPWNGLTSVTDSTPSDVKSFYQDGVKYLDQHTTGTFAGSVKAFTYPDELNHYIGQEEFAPGVFLHEQPGKTFSMCYRTKEGDDLNPDAGYKIHVIYNVVAIPGNFDASTIGDAMKPTEMDWSLSGTPPEIMGARPTSHISLRSRSMNPELLATLEGMLYGNDNEDPYLPSFIELMGIIEAG